MNGMVSRGLIENLEILLIQHGSRELEACLSETLSIFSRIIPSTHFRSELYFLIPANFHFEVVSQDNCSPEEEIPLSLRRSI